ncbi:uncharacterized protein B0H18DRAFT_1007118 [Fomitopsis serialis]|uniref:uncharacterized protein n=1 Tax=Fomitopsis serialis TaxID=139415 RepID=UPI0020081275|nr:uncharacterized protein B0H18DRAFT_1007118 [Neoantrodia serialis]KAH9925960.1 hypothetical protein B0H18DRAFT_1007118 [Neoantrodia serialis]
MTNERAGEQADDRAARSCLILEQNSTHHIRPAGDIASDAERASRSLLDQYQAVRNHCPLSSRLAVASPTTEVEKPQTGSSRDDKSDVSTCALRPQQEVPPTRSVSASPTDRSPRHVPRQAQTTPCKMRRRTAYLVPGKPPRQMCRRTRHRSLRPGPRSISLCPRHTSTRLRPSGCRCASVPRPLSEPRAEMTSCPLALSHLVDPFICSSTCLPVY